MLFTLKIDPFGRIVIPKKVRDDLNLSTHSELQMKLQNGEITLKAKSQDSPVRMNDQVLTYTGGSSNKIDWSPKGMREARIQDLVT